MIDIATYPPVDFHNMIHYTQIIWEEVAFSWKVTGKAVAISIAPTVCRELYSNQTNNNKS